MAERNELFLYSIYNPHERGWFFGAGNPEFWKHQETLVKNKGKVLDLGMGTSRSSLFFALHGMNVVGYDLDEEQVALVNEMAKSEALPIEGKVGDIREINLGKNKFDLVILDFTFVHFGSLEEAEAVLDKAYTSLKPNGHIWVRAVGKSDECYLNLLWQAEHDSPDVEKVNNDVIKSLCDCSGELRMDPHLFFDQTHLLEYFAQKGARFVETRTIPGKPIEDPNIMYGEDWPSTRQNGEAFGTITILAQKKS